MKKLLNNILVPVHFNNNPELAIEKALEIANHFQCGLHLLHVEHGTFVSLTAEGFFFSSLKEGETADREKALAQLKEKYSPLLHTGLAFKTGLRKGNMEQMIAEYAIQHHIDLILLDRPGNTVWSRLSGAININRLSRRTNCAVLTIKNRLALENVRNIVLPVDEQLPLRKIIFAGYLANRFNSRIHLIALTKRYRRSQADDTAYLYKAWQLLHDNTNLPVECHTVPGQHIADTTLQYAKQINADLIVVNPGRELLLSGFINRLFARFLFNESRIPVMTVHPA